MRTNQPLVRTLPAIARAAASFALAVACAEPATPVAGPAPHVSPDLRVQAETWTYELLGNIGGSPGAYFMTSAVNDSGHVAGVGKHPLGPTVAWRWRNGAFSTTAPFDSTWGGGYGINGRGDIFGKRSTNMVTWSAMIWHKGPFGSAEWSFPRLTPGADTEGRDINDNGYAVGWECVTYGAGFCALTAILWKPTQPVYPWTPSPVALGPLGDEDRAFAINNLATVLGHTRLGGHDRTWLKPLGGAMQALPLGTIYTDSWPGDVNDVGVVVGVAYEAGRRRFRVVTWRGVTRPVDAGVPIDAESYPNQRADVRINKHGRIAGMGDGKVPFTFKGKTFTVLPVPAGTSGHVSDLNTCGEIVGVLQRPNNGGRELIRWRRTQHGQPVCD